MNDNGIDKILTKEGPVEELELDDALWQHLKERGTYPKHVVKLFEILQVFGHAPKLFLNPSETGHAPLIMVGPTDSGRMLCVPLVPTGKCGIWRPVTAFEANTHHRNKYHGVEL